MTNQTNNNGTTKLNVATEILLLPNFFLFFVPKEPGPRIPNTTLLTINAGFFLFLFSTIRWNRFRLDPAGPP